MDCKKERCKFLHTSHLKRNNKVPCKYMDKCNDKECNFIHPEIEKESEKNKENVNNPKGTSKKEEDVMIEKDSD